MFGTTGSPEQFDNVMKNILIFLKNQQKALKVFGSAMKVEKKFMQS